MNELEPTPPQFVKNIAWFLQNWRRYKLVIFIGFIISAVSLSYTLYPYFEPYLISDNNDSTHEGSPPFIINLKNGGLARMDISLTYKINENAPLSIITQFDNSEEAFEVLMDAVRSAILKIVESKSVEEIRSNRKK